MPSHREQQNEYPDLFAWAFATGPMIDTSAKLTNAYCTQAMEVASELTDFTMRRMQEDARLPERLMQCRTAQDMQQTWLDFWKTAIAQYQGEWSRLAELGGSLNAMHVAGVEKRHNGRRIAA